MPARRTTPAAAPLTARAGARGAAKAKRAATPPATLAALRAEEARLEAELAMPPELPEISAGGDDVHLVAEALVTDNARKSFLAKKLEDTRLALRAAERGRYGICERCGEPIPPARLEIVPDATSCVPCASTRR